MNGFRYATLDNAAASETNLNNQEQPLSLPSGWALAPHDSTVLNVAGSYPWGMITYDSLGHLFDRVHVGYRCGLSGPWRWNVSYDADGRVVRGDICRSEWTIAC